MHMTRYNQHELRTQMPKSFGLNPEGVCRSLVGQWLRTAGHIKRTAFKAAATAAEWSAADDLVAGHMAVDREPMFDSMELTVIDSDTYEINGFNDLVRRLAKGGSFYLALKDPSTGAGHALGIVVSGSKWRLFDPNAIEASCSMQSFQTFLSKLLVGYAEGDGNWRLTRWELQEVWAT